MQYYSALTKKEIPPLVTTWINLEDTKLNGLSQTQKDKCYVISLPCGV